MNRHIVLTPGDPTGIGPEITVKALQRLDELPEARITVIGSLAALRKAAFQLGVPLPEHDRLSYETVEEAEPGLIAFRSIAQAVAQIAGDGADALITGPISKQNLHKAGYAFSGHTEILEDLARKLFDAPDARAEMLFVHKTLRLLLLTRHLPLSEVPAALAKPGAVAKPLKTLIAFLRHRLKIDTPRIALLGINPHAGEIGGEEETRYLKPIINAVNNVGGSVLEGPFPADGFFRKLDASGAPYDAIVAAYHDQGLIPFKMLAGYGAVNVTIGLPFIRTSVSHGTAADIAGRGSADESSLIAALHAALELL